MKGESGAGARRRGFVYAAGELLARVEGGEVRWEHRQPATGGRWESAASGAAWALTELDPLGADVGTESPYEPGIAPAEPIIFDSGSHWATRAGTAGDPQSGCNATGLALPCELIARMMRDGSAYIPDTHRDPTLPAGFGVIPWVPSRFEETDNLWEVGRRLIDHTSVMSPNSSFFLNPSTLRR